MQAAPSESQEQATLFTWAYMQREKYPELQWMFHVPNGGMRDKVTAAKLKREGVKSGFPDVALMLQRGGYFGLFIEMKRQKGGVASKEQKLWLAHLNEQGYKAVVCNGFEEARRQLLHYLSL